MMGGNHTKNACNKPNTVVASAKTIALTSVELCPLRPLLSFKNREKYAVDLQFSPQQTRASVHALISVIICPKQNQYNKTE